MGLDFRGADARWSYGGFNRFRTRLAAIIGVNLDKMAGFAERGISWETVKDDIVPLLCHSDCDGSLTYGQCKKVAPRLRALVKEWPDADYDKQQALLLAEGMEECGAAKKKLIFC